MKPPAKENQTMKRATIRGSRVLADGRRYVNVVCPLCDRRHWLPADGTGRCPRRHGCFTITSDRKGVV
jgi:cytidylate kinase